MAQNNTWKCPKCGNQNSLLFCSNCGTKKPEKTTNQNGDVFSSLFSSMNKENKKGKDIPATKKSETPTVQDSKQIKNSSVNDLLQKASASIKIAKPDKKETKNTQPEIRNSEANMISSSPENKQEQSFNNTESVAKPNAKPKNEEKKDSTAKQPSHSVQDKENLNTESVAKPKAEKTASANKIQAVQETIVKINSEQNKEKKVVSKENADNVVLPPIVITPNALPNKGRTDNDTALKTNAKQILDSFETPQSNDDSNVFPARKGYSQEEARKKLKLISPDKETESKLKNILFTHVRGFRYIFIGESGSKKDKTLIEIAKLMYDIGKIEKPLCTFTPFHDIPDTFDANKLYVIEDLSAAVANLFNMDDLSTSSTVTQEEYKKRMNSLISAGNNAYIILNTNETEIRGFMPIDPRLGFTFPKTKWVSFSELSNVEIANAFYKYLPEYHRSLVTDEFKSDFLGYLKRNRRYFPFNNDDLAEYLATQVALSEDLTLPKEKYNSNTLEQSFSNIIGMKIVKDQINELNEYLVARAKLESLGAKLPTFNLHMMFLGNPGVGKTTIARIIAKLLFDLGYIKEDKLIEVASNDLIGVHGNETGMKTNRVIMRALGGVLFVDEAYSLAQSCGTAGLEAIATLVKCMEDYKENLVCMFAGYSKEMDDFVRANSGIASRINYIFEFEDYTAQELYDIFELKLNRMGLTIDPNAKETLFKVAKFGAGRRNFGNGRYIDKLLQRALTKHALLDLPKDKMLVLQKESIPTVEEIMKSFGRFSA